MTCIACSCLNAKPADFVPGSKLHERCAIPPNSDRFSAAINAVQVDRVLRHGYMGAWISEQDNVWSASADQLRAAHRNETQEMRDAQNFRRTELHTEIAHMSTRGTIRIVKNSSHYFQLEQPESVSAAVLEVVGAARAR
jgi:hypothetical protein